LFNAGQPGGDQRGESEIRIEVRAADAALDADRLAVFPAQAESSRAVVATPHDPGRRKSTNLKALVRIDVGREEIGDVARILELAGKERARQRRHAVLGLAIEEQRLLAGVVP